MISKTKTDNHNPAAKLALRRYFLEKYHSEPPDVMDCCQGSGLLWNEIRKTHEVKTYWGMDIKPQKGRLKIDSSRVLQQRGWTQNVIDIDTYGSPWKHWYAMLPNIIRPVTVFLTVGQISLSSPSKDAYAAIGIRFKIPMGIGVKLKKIVVPYLLCDALKYCTITEAMEAESTANMNARYIGVHLVPV